MTAEEAQIERRLVQAMQELEENKRSAEAVSKEHALKAVIAQSNDDPAERRHMEKALVENGVKVGCIIALEILHKWRVELVNSKNH